MKLIQPTFKRYPADTADAVYIRELAHAFARILNDQYVLVVARNMSDELKGIKHYSLKTRIPQLRPLYYVAWLMWRIITKEYWGRGRAFFTSDLYLLRVLIFARMVFRFQYRVCADWHSFKGYTRERIIARYADRHVTTTEYLRKRLIEHCTINPQSIMAIHGGVSLVDNRDDSDHLRKALGYTNDVYVMAYVGYFKTLGMEKGIRTMIESLLHLDVSVCALFVGAREGEIEEYREYAQTCGVLNRCCFIEHMSSKDIQAYMNVADVLVIPYPDEPHFRESGFPMKTYEYMAHKRPIVYAQLPIIEEVLGGCGTPFCPGDSFDLARAVDELRTDPVQAEDCARVAYTGVQHLTWDHKAERIIKYVQT